MHGFVFPRKAAMSRPVRVREIDNDEQARRLQIVRRGGSSLIVSWLRRQMVLISVRCLEVAAITEAAFISADWVREVLHQCATDEFNSPLPHYAGGRPRKRTVEQREQIKKLTLERLWGLVCRCLPRACRSWRISWWCRRWLIFHSMKDCTLLRENDVWLSGP